MGPVLQHHLPLRCGSDDVRSHRIVEEAGEVHGPLGVRPGDERGAPVVRPPCSISTSTIAAAPASEASIHARVPSAAGGMIATSAPRNRSTSEATTTSSSAPAAMVDDVADDRLHHATSAVPAGDDRDAVAAPPRTADDAQFDRSGGDDLGGADPGEDRRPRRSRQRRFVVLRRQRPQLLGCNDPSDDKPRPSPTSGCARLGVAGDRSRRPSIPWCSSASARCGAFARGVAIGDEHDPV